MQRSCIVDVPSMEGLGGMGREECGIADKTVAHCLGRKLHLDATLRRLLLEEGGAASLPRMRIRAWVALLVAAPTF